MRRRQLVLVIAGSAFLGLVLLAVGAVYSVTNTAWGLEQVRQLVVSQAKAAVHGKLYLGRISGSLLGDVTIDSLEIRDAKDSLFVASGPISVSYDVRDLIDRRIELLSVSVTRPILRIHERTDGTWNWKEIFPPPKKPRVPVAPTRGFGDYVVIDTISVKDAMITVVQPWVQSDTLTPVMKDSLLQIARTEHVLRQAPGGKWEKVLTWWRTNLEAGRVRLAHPDSEGQLVRVAHLSTEEGDPKFSFRDLQGVIRKNDDTLWLDVKHLALAHSTGRGNGRIEWGGNKPMRWDIRVVGDSACMEDYTWIYIGLPRSGCGRTNLWIHNERQLEIMDYELTNFDLRSTKSRLRGKMTYGVGGPKLIVKDVDLDLIPVDFDLLRVFKGGPFSYDFQGTLEGHLTASGGPVDRFKIEKADIAYHDAHVAGAVSTMKGQGTINIEVPANAKFLNFPLDIASLDLRTIRYLNKSFPELNGIIRGHVVLDSLWYDVRFHDADIEHVDGPGTPTRLLGRGRMTVEDQFTRFDVQMNAQPMSFGMLAQSYPKIPMRVPMSGPFTAVGRADSLVMTANFAAPGGTLAFDGVVDAEAPVRGFVGTLTFDSLDLRQIRPAASPPITRLTGRVTGAIAGDTLVPTMVGELAVELGRSVVDGVRISSLKGDLSFADSVMRVDSLRIDGPAATLVIDGGLGLAKPHRDSLLVTAVVDSLGGLRRWLKSADPSAVDTLAGAVTASAVLRGNLDSLDVSATLDGVGLVRNGARARHATAQLTLRDLQGGAFVDVDAALDTVSVAGLSFVHGDVTAHTKERGVTDIAVRANASTGPALSTSGTVTQRGDSMFVALDRGTVVVADEAWTLDGGVRVALIGDDIRVDSLALRGPEGARLHARGSLPASGVVDLAAGIDKVPLSTLARIAGTETSARGLVDLEWHAGGTRVAPVMDFTAALTDVLSAGARAFRLDANGTYRDRRLETGLALRERNATLATGAFSLPLDLALESRQSRRIDDAPLRGSLRAPALDLTVVEAFTAAVSEAAGRIDLAADLQGTWQAPRITGALSAQGSRLRLAALGKVQLTDVTADVAFLGDSLLVRKLAARSAPHATRIGRGIAPGRSGTALLEGSVGFANLDDPALDLHLTADNFNAVSKPRLADLDLSGDLRLTGPVSGATLAGSATVNRGTLYIPDLGQKDIVDPTSEDFLRVVDTALFNDERLLAVRPSAFVNNLIVKNVQIEMGSDVWLRSAEANINLGGTVSVARQRAVRGADTSAATLTLDGTLLVNRGTYRLSVGDVVQRTFDVEQGKVIFSPYDPTFNPGLDISAVHTVRKFNSSLVQLDKKIRVRIGGTLQQPSLAFESADNAQLSQSDLISYLITGGPAFGIGDPTQNSSAASTAANVLLTSLSSSLADRLASLGYLDYVQIQTAGLDRGLEAAGTTQDASTILSRTRVGGGVQLSDRLFLSGDAGLCTFFGSASSSASPWTQLGVRLEYRIGGGFSASASVEPPTASLLCDQASASRLRGFALTPQQFGVDLSTAWRF